MSAFIITQRVEEAEEYCDKVAILKAGQIIEFGSPFELKEKYCSSYFLRVYPTDNMSSFLLDNQTDSHSFLF